MLDPWTQGLEGAGPMITIMETEDIKAVIGKPFQPVTHLIQFIQVQQHIEGAVLQPVRFRPATVVANSHAIKA